MIFDPLGYRNEGIIVSDLQSLFKHVQASLVLIDSAPAREAALGNQRRQEVDVEDQVASSSSSRFISFLMSLSAL